MYLISKYASCAINPGDDEGWIRETPLMVLLVMPLMLLLLVLPLVLPLVLTPPSPFARC